MTKIALVTGAKGFIGSHLFKSIQAKGLRGRIAALQHHFALYFIGFARTVSEIAKEQITVTLHPKHELESMFQMVNEAEATITNPNRSLDEFGHLLHESQQVKRTLTQNITNINLDEIYEAGRSAGALASFAERAAVSCCS